LFAGQAPHVGVASQVPWIVVSDEQQHSTRKAAASPPELSCAGQPARSGARAEAARNVLKNPMR